MNTWQVEHVEAREWPNASLGCPKPGVNYAEVISPGYLIRLRSGGRVMEYRSGRFTTVYCSG